MFLVVEVWVLAFSDKCMRHLGVDPSHEPHQVFAGSGQGVLIKYLAELLYEGGPRLFVSIGIIPWGSSETYEESRARRNRECPAGLNSFEVTFVNLRQDLTCLEKKKVYVFL